jgi:hypothetical protein
MDLETDLMFGLVRSRKEDTVSDTWGSGTYAGAEDTSAGVATDSDVFYGSDPGPAEDED